MSAPAQRAPSAQGRVEAGAMRNKLLDAIRNKILEVYGVFRERWFFTAIQSVALVVAAWWWRHLPSPGLAIAVLAGIAAVMSVHSEMHDWHKSVWVLIIGVFLTLEISAIRHDRAESDIKERNARTEENKSFEKILETQQKNFAQILSQQQSNFVTTMKTLIGSHVQDRAQFSQLLVKEQDLFASQQEFSERLSGRLVAGNSPTPPNACSVFNRLPNKDDVLVIAGNNAAIINRFPFAIVRLGDTDTLAIDRISATGVIALGIDIRSKDNRILLNLNKSGVVNRDAHLIVLRPDKSTFLVEDDYGHEVLRAEFLNRNTFVVRGTVGYCGMPLPLDKLGDGNCMPYMASGMFQDRGSCPILP